MSTNAPVPHSDSLSGSLPGAGFIVVDLPCLRCGYNLRTLSRHGSCPECGLHVALSQIGDRFNPLDTRRARAVIRGCLALALSVAMTCGLMIFLWMAFNGDVPFGDDYAGAMIGWIIVDHLLWVVGGWWVTARPYAATRLSGLVKGVRIATIATFLSMMLVVQLQAALIFDWLDVSGMLLAIVLLPTMFMARLAAVVLLGRWLSRLASELDAPVLSREVAVIAYLTATGLLGVLLSIAAVVTGGGNDIETFWKVLTVAFAFLTIWATIWLLRFAWAVRQEIRYASASAGDVGVKLAQQVERFQR